MSKVLVIGGGGYVGSALCPALKTAGHEVAAYDTFWYGENMLPNSIKKIVGDMRDEKKLRLELQGYDAVIHLACISNDPSFDLNPALGRSINLDCFPMICDAIRDAKIKRFIYASSSSVYGVHQGSVDEKTECNPLTDYSKYKLECEKYLKIAYMKDTVWTIVRPATVCGYAPRLRLDLIVNILAANILAKRELTVFGGSQKRPNIHIDDMVKAYSLLLSADKYQVDRKVFNVGGENITVSKIASRVIHAVGDKEVLAKISPSTDDRSYHISSKFIDQMIGFTAKKTIEDAVYSLISVFPLLKDPLNNPQYHNIKKMKELEL